MCHRTKRRHYRPLDTAADAVAVAVVVGIGDDVDVADGVDRVGVLQCAAAVVVVVVVGGEPTCCPTRLVRDRYLTADG